MRSSLRTSNESSVPVRSCGIGNCGYRVKIIMAIQLQMRRSLELSLYLVCGSIKGSSRDSALQILPCLSLRSVQRQRHQQVPVDRHRSTLSTCPSYAPNRLTKENFLRILGLQCALRLWRGSSACGSATKALVSQNACVAGREMTS